MLKDGQKGVILQRDKKTYGIAPHLPCGLVTPEILETFADVARKYNVPTLKITSAARIALSELAPSRTRTGMSRYDAIREACIEAV